jgi:hypothetical protein
VTKEQWRSLTPQEQTAYAYTYGAPPLSYLQAPEPPTPGVLPLGVAVVLSFLAMSVLAGLFVTGVLTIR